MSIPEGVSPQEVVDAFDKAVAGSDRPAGILRGVIAVNQLVTQAKLRAGGPSGFRIVNTDNFGGDYPDERFVENLPRLTQAHAELVCKAINAGLPENHDRYFKVVPGDYVLQPGFEP